MSDDLTFMMGKFAAVLPGGLRYARNHMWCCPSPEAEPAARRLRFGFTSYAVRLMKDVYFLDWIVDGDAVVTLKQHIGHIETSKAQSDLFAPIAGQLAGFNQELLRDPSAINVDNYGPGWLFEMEGNLAGTLSAIEYHQYLDAGWETTQRILKGHV